MKNKFAVILSICLLLTATLMFYACNDTQGTANDSVCITVKTFGTGIDMSDEHQGVVRTINEESVHVKAGERFDWTVYAEYRQSIGKPLGGFGGEKALGFYTDYQCRNKYDENEAVNENITLYIDTRPSAPLSNEHANYCLVNFVFEGESYCIFRYFSETLHTSDFIVSAYGKNIDESALKFYSDAEFSYEYDMDNMPQIIAMKDKWNMCPGELTVYVKRV